VTYFKAVFAAYRDVLLTARLPACRSSDAARLLLAASVRTHVTSAVAVRIARAI